MPVEIRPANVADAPLIADLTVRLTDEIIERTGHGHFDLDREQAVALCEAFLQEGRYRSLVAVDDLSGKAVGVANLCESCALYAAGVFGIIQEFYVLPAYRSQDVGAALLQAIQELGREAGWSRIELCTPPLPEFARTLAFYERNGYAVTGGRKLRRLL